MKSLANRLIVIEHSGSLNFPDRIVRGLLFFVTIKSKKYTKRNNFYSISIELSLRFSIFVDCLFHAGYDIIY